MASNSSSMVTIFIFLNLLLFTFTNGACNSPSIPTPAISRPTPTSPRSPSGSTTPSTTPSTSTGKCPVDALKLGVCVNVLSGLISAVIGTPPSEPCCSLIQGLADLEAAICLCTVIKASILGINLNIPLSLSLLVNYCGKNVPSGFQCP